MARANNYRKMLCDFFWANKSLGIFHWHAEIRRKLLILCTESSKIWHKIVTFSAPNVLNPLPSLNMHLIIKNALLWDQKFLNWRDLSIFKNAVLVLSSTTVHWWTKIHENVIEKGLPDMQNHGFGQKWPGQGVLVT